MPINPLTGREEGTFFGPPEGPWFFRRRERTGQGETWAFECIPTAEQSCVYCRHWQPANERDTANKAECGLFRILLTGELAATDCLDAKRPNYQGIASVPLITGRWYGCQRWERLEE